MEASALHLVAPWPARLGVDADRRRLHVAGQIALRLGGVPPASSIDTPET
jgi:hypothetical protein